MIREEEKDENVNPLAGKDGKEEEEFVPIDVNYEPLFPQINEARKKERLIEISDLKDYLCRNGFRTGKVDGNNSLNSGIVMDSTLYEIFDDDEMLKKIGRSEMFYTANDLKELPV